MDKVNSNLQMCLWNGTIPLEITLHNTDLTDVASLPPLYIQAPRQSLWSHVLSEVHSYFGPHTGPIFTAGSTVIEYPYTLESNSSCVLTEVPSSCWLEGPGGYAIDWTTPVGVVADMLSHNLTNTPKINPSHPFYATIKPYTPFPLKLVAHFSGMPSSLPPHTIPIQHATQPSGTPSTYTHVHVPSTLHQQQLKSVVKQASQLLYGSTSAIFGLSSALTDDLIAHAYHPTPCARARAQASVCVSAQLLPPVVAACADVTRWRAAAQALDVEAHRAWAATRGREKDRIEAELRREDGRAEAEAEAEAEEEQVGDVGDADAAVPVGLDALRARRAELAEQLGSAYSSQTDTWGPHAHAVPIRLYANTHARVPAEARREGDGKGAPLLSRCRIWGDSESESVAELAARLMPSKRYGEDIVLVAQGIELAGDVPLRWAYTHFRHPDLWLHLVATAAAPK